MPPSTYGRGLRGLSLATIATISLALVLVFFYAPLDADQGFIQKIFYIHVPLAIVSLCGFIFGGVLAIGHLRTGDRALGHALVRGDPHGADLRGRSADHRIDLGQGLLGPLVGVERADARLVPDRRAAVRDLSAAAVRDRGSDAARPGTRACSQSSQARSCRSTSSPCALAQQYVHPRVLTLAGGNLPGSMRLTFLISLVGITLLYVTLWKYEMAAKNARMQVRRLRRTLLGDDAVRRLRKERGPVMSALLTLATAPALPLHSAGKYVAGAYIVFVALILIYVAIMARRLTRTERDLAELRREVEAAQAQRGSRPRSHRGSEMSELLAIGVSHKTAPVEVRERLALPEARAADFLRDLRGSGEVHEAVAISTCNRTELYLVVGDPVEAEGTVLSMLASQAGIRPTSLASAIYSPPQLRCRPAPVPRHRGPGVDDRRRGRDPGPGQARLRGRARQGHRRTADQPPVQGGAGDRQAGAHRDRDRRAPAQPAGRRGRAGPRAARTAHRPRGRDRGNRRDERADRAGAGRQRRQHGVRRQPPARPGAVARQALPRTQRQLRRAAPGADQRRHRRRRDRVAARCCSRPASWRR